MKAFALNLNKRQGDPCFQIESRNDGNITWSENKIGRSLAGSLGMTWELGGYGGAEVLLNDIVIPNVSEGSLYKI